jgi:hypothetical protein
MLRQQLILSGLMALLLSTGAAALPCPASAQERTSGTAAAPDTPPVAKLGGMDPKHSPFFKPWINGVSAGEPQMQVQRYDDDTYVIRQSIRTNFEGPFLYLLFGSDRALLIDTGAGGLNVRPMIDRTRLSSGSMPRTWPTSSRSPTGRIRSWRMTSAAACSRSFRRPATSRRTS